MYNLYSLFLKFETIIHKNIDRICYTEIILVLKTSRNRRVL